MNHINRSKIILNTGNNVFDNFIGLKLNEMKFNDIDMNINIFIGIHDFYNDLQFINTFITLLDLCKNVKYLNIHLEQKDNDLLIRLVYVDGYVDIDLIQQLLEKNKISYNLDNHENKGIRIYYQLGEYQ